MSEIPERVGFVTEDRMTAEQAKILGIPVMTADELVAKLETDDLDRGELTRGDVEAVVAANPKLTNPLWVEAELCARGIHVHLTGEWWDPAVPLGAAVRDNADRWARIAGGKTDDILTADLVNRGKLIDILCSEADAPDVDAG